jgi:formylglycine-generating enzyme required for sulfatase activity
MKKPVLIAAFFIALVSNRTHASESEFFNVRGVPFEMVFVEGGSFMMGCDTNSVRCIRDEVPMHRVTLSDFYIGKSEVTQLLWQAVMGNNPSKLKGDHLPVELVSYKDCQTFIKRLSEITGRQFAMPTEAQWEYSARGGNKSRGYKYSGSNDIDAVAWYSGNSGGRPRRVADKLPNELGIYDMTGNVFEWCSDWYNEKYYESSPEESPTGFALGTFRVFRGGSWRNTPQFCNVTRRNYIRPDKRYNDLGLRLVLIP